MRGCADCVLSYKKHQGCESNNKKHKRDEEAIHAATDSILCYHDSLMDNLPFKTPAFITQCESISQNDNDRAAGMQANAIHTALTRAGREAMHH